ncbi:Translation Initiation factor eIF- 4e-like domain [Pseudocohnilembus persalinus]|uniref:Translation Initiation factor eIF-4e-like domain n=1 Tax=Pseudocohnilembus persalinus TaxID=266149 RepID=A0A0V0QQA4_PSEPJ|nr:Translation Initiation factor eIF- 4e-like domain [Pseudocohnilembus persalinus]|eukprot:KRX04192.1 Translation Initiation factor eIF- 4e-like domain [Pseudocohnilembus persalinus]
MQDQQQLRDALASFNFSDENESQQDTNTQQNISEDKLDRKYTFYLILTQSWTTIKVGEFDTVQQFWRIYQYFQQLDQWDFNAKFALFAEDITPEWEHKSNLASTKIRVDKKAYQLAAGNLILGFIGGQCVLQNHFNGLIFGNKQNGPIIEIWVDYCDNKDLDLKMNSWIIQTLKAKPQNTIKFIPFKNKQEADTKK